jgi:hypothetical protein|tara:strand:+ start:403 stop:633 length:231 start_codon:yes stop_codon:yes gene_type:complete
MSKTYSQHYVISSWLKTMDCSEGCDEKSFPKSVDRPAGYETDDINVSSVDVMDFLGLKRSKSVKAPAPAPTEIKED